MSEDQHGTNGSTSDGWNATALSRENYQYCYCEENVLRLLQLRAFPEGRTYVVSITGDGPFFAIGAARTPEGIALWDYHVIALVHAPVLASFVVYDLDSALPFPVSLQRYAEAALNLPCVESALPRFRIFTSDEYRAELSSDRGHMRDAHGNWLKTPPSWPAPLNPGGNITIDLFRDSRDVNRPGKLIRSSDAFLNFFAERL